MEVPYTQVQLRKAVWDFLQESGISQEWACLSTSAMLSHCLEAACKKQSFSVTQ